MKISFIHIASGFESRFGSNKLLVPSKRKALYCHGLDYICHVVGELEGEGYQTEVPVVNQYEEVLEQVESQGLWAVLNRLSGQGVIASPRLGTDLAPPESEALLFPIIDRPYVSPFTLKGLIRGSRLAGKGTSCVCHQGKRGNLAVFTNVYGEELMGLHGDRGGSVIMKTHPKDVWIMKVPEEGLKDTDWAEDLGAVQS